MTIEFPVKQHRKKFLKRGIALDITMALLILLSFLVIVFFSLVTTNRQIENAITGGVTARLLAVVSSNEFAIYGDDAA